MARVGMIEMLVQGSGLKKGEKRPGWSLEQLLSSGNLVIGTTPAEFKRRQQNCQGDVQLGGRPSL